MSQDAVLDSIKASTWVSSPIIVDSTLFAMNSIILQKQSESLDSLKEDVTLWDFSDSLFLEKYDVYTKEKKALGSGVYCVFSDGELYIKDEQGLIFPYRFALTTTGNFLMIVRKKQ